MHLDRVIVRTYRRSDVLSTIPDDQNTLTCQYVDTNDTLRDPLHGPITSFPFNPPLGAVPELQIGPVFFFLGLPPHFFTGFITCFGME